MGKRTYILLPFRYTKRPSGKVLLTNEVGEFIFLSETDFLKLVSYSLPTDSDIFLDLKAKNIVTDSDLEPMIDLLAIKYRTKKRFLYDFTSLHMVVPTLRCNSKCIYCQVSSRSEKTPGYDMDKRTAKKVVDIIFQTPSRNIKIEFQGGEPLLNFEVLAYIVKYAEKLNILYGKSLQFVVCTNLTLIDERILRFFRKHNIFISTSLDGPETIHNKNRPLANGTNSYQVFVKNLKLAQNVLGKENISALMVTTLSNVFKFKEIIDEYIDLGFSSIFLRTLNPYGRAKNENVDFSCSLENFIEAYKRAIDYIISLNLKGVYFVEEFACLLLKKLLTPFATGFVDMQSPAGIGIGGVIYNYNGDVYVSDEGRMLGEMGDKKFKMGNVLEQSYEELFNNDMLRSLIHGSCIETLPTCHSCVYAPYCGLDPVRNYLEQNDCVGNRARDILCKRNKAILSYFMDLIEQNNKDIMDVFFAWITNRTVTEVSMKDMVHV